jgi:MFS transporter, OFA family, oxalate/formate antiporter
MFHAARRVHSGLTILGCFGGGSLYGWSGFMPAVRSHFSAGNTTASIVFSLALISFTLGVLLGPILLARVYSRYRLTLLAGFAALFLCIAGASVGFAGFVVSYGLCFGFASGALYNHAISEASASGSATLLVPVSVAAFGLGGAVFGPVQVWLTALDWALWSLAPALVCLALVAIAALVVRPPVVVERKVEQRGRTVIKPVRTIVILGIIFATGSCSGLIVLGFASQILPSEAVSVGLASLTIFLAAVGNTLGRLSATLSAGKFGPARGIAGALVLSMIALCGLIVSTATSVIGAMLFVVAFAYGQLAATMPLMVREQVNESSFSGAFGWVFIGWGVAGLVGPWSAGWFLDVTGTVRFSLAICIALCALCLCLVLKFVPATKAE